MTTHVDEGEITVGDVEPLIKVDEAAALLQVPKSWLYDQARKNEFPHVRLGRYVRFRKADVIARMEASS